MKRPTRSLVAPTLAALLAVLMTACGGGTTGPDDDPDPMGGDPEPYWEMVVTSGTDEEFEVTGTTVAFAGPNVVVLGGSTPAGWTVSFTVSGDVPIGLPNSTDNDDLLNATVGAPTGADCIATPATNHALPSFVTLGPAADGVPVGIGSVYVDGGCGGFADETSFQLGFGVQ